MGHYPNLIVLPMKTEQATFGTIAARWIPNLLSRKIFFNGTPSAVDGITGS